MAMYDDDNFGGIFPTRTGVPTGSANERKMLDSIGGSDGFRTQQKTNSDGSVTMLRTRNGMPEFSRSGGEQVGEKYIELDYSLRFLEDDNAMTYNFDMLNTPLVGDKTLYIEQRPRDTPAGDVNYRASNTKLVTTDGLLETDYQLTLQKAIIQPDAGAARTAKFTSAAPVTAWFADDDIIRGPTGVHALVRKAKIVNMLVNGRPANLYLQPPPYETPAGEGLCVLDQIRKLGDPWHGLVRGNTLTLPNGSTRPADRLIDRPGMLDGILYPLIPYGVVPAETSDAADVAAGRTWLNYGLLAGFCLYEQSIAVWGASWVYIAPDNSTWRVQYTHSFETGVWGLNLRFYPLRRTFLTVDKGGGLVQTIFAPISPSSSAYRNGVLYDIDSKGKNAVLFNDFGANRGASLINIQGIPPAATATNTLLCDASAAPSPYVMSSYLGIETIQKNTWNYRSFEVDMRPTYVEPAELRGPPIITHGPWVTYIQDVLDDMNPDPAPEDFLPPPWSNLPEGYGGWEWVLQSREEASRVQYEDIMGYCFDSNDNLVEVNKVEGYDTHRILDYTGGGIIGVPCVYFFRVKMGSSTFASIEWDYNGISLATVQPNAYGYVFIYGVGRISLNVVRYTNRVYGMSILKIGAAMTNWLPPVSPDGASPYVADIIATFKPYATYHPIKQELVWETNPVQFV